MEFNSSEECNWNLRRVLSLEEKLNQRSSRQFQTVMVNGAPWSITAWLYSIMSTRADWYDAIVENVAMKHISLGSIKRNRIGRLVSRPGYDVIPNSERAPKGEVVEKIILYPDGAPSGRLPIW